MQLIGAINHKRRPSRTAFSLFDWILTQGDGTAVTDADGRVLNINDGTVSTLATATAWATPGMLTATAGSAKKHAWADVWSTTTGEFRGDLGESLLLFVRGKWSVPAASSADWGVFGTANGSGAGVKGFALKVGGATGTRPGKGVWNYYVNDTVVGVGGLETGSVPTWVDGAEHTVAQFLNFATGDVRTYVDGVMRVSGTSSGIVRQELRMAIAAGNGRLMLGATNDNSAPATGGGQFLRALGLRRPSAPSSASADALVARLHGIAHYVVTVSDWDEAA